MQPARGGGIADGFTDGYGECDDVMTHTRFEISDPHDDGGVDTRARSNRIGGGARYNATLGKRLGRGELDFKPASELAFFAPDAAHLFARVSRDQFRLLRILPARSGQHLKTAGEFPIL
jgi:hypothetical protein